MKIGVPSLFPGKNANNFLIVPVNPECGQASQNSKPRKEQERPLPTLQPDDFLKQIHGFRPI